jgi:hypothetical protein
MVWVHLIGLIFLTVSQWMDVHVIYQEVSPCSEEFTVIMLHDNADRQPYIKVGRSIEPRPWQIFPADQQRTYKVSAYLVTMTFWCLLIAHAEEVSAVLVSSCQEALTTR